MTRATLSWPLYLTPVFWHLYFYIFTSVFLHFYKCFFYKCTFLKLSFFTLAYLQVSIYKYSFSHLRIFTSAFLQVSIFTLVHIYKCPHLQVPFIYKGRFTSRFFSSTPHTVTHFTTLFGFKSPPPDGDTVRVPAGYARRARGLRPPLNFTSTKNCDETRPVETRRDSTRRIDRSLDRSKLVESEGRVTSRPDKREIKKNVNGKVLPRFFSGSSRLERSRSRRETKRKRSLTWKSKKC